MRFLGRGLMGLFLLSVTAGFLALAGAMLFGALETRLADEMTPRPSRERVFAVRVATVQSGEITPVMTVFGEVLSRRRLDIRATSSGRIVYMADAFVEGGVVVAGTLLLRIDPAEAQSALARASSDLAEAEAEHRDSLLAFELAQDERAASAAQAGLRRQALSRQEDLRSRGVGTEAAVEAAALAASQADQAVLARRQAEAQARSRIAQAEIRLARQEITRADAERALADTEIYAGFSGTLGDVSLVLGGVVQNSERLAQLTDPDQLEVSFRLSTVQYARLLDSEGGLLHSGVEVVLDVSGIDLVAEGNITRESATVGEGQTGRLLFAQLSQTPGFRPGDFVTLRIAEPPLTGVMRLPATAIDSNDRVLVLDADSRLEDHDITLLRRQDDDVIVRLDGLEGREVVTERSPLLGAGILVRPVRPEAAAQSDSDEELVALTGERRARLIAFVETNERMPEDVRSRVLNQLAQDRVPARMVARLEARLGG